MRLREVISGLINKEIGGFNINFKGMNMKKILIVLAMTSVYSTLQAATLKVDTNYDIVINAESSCFALIGDCREGSLALNPGAVISISTTSDGLGGVNFVVTSATDMIYPDTPRGVFTVSNIGGFGNVDSLGNISYTPEGRLAVAQFAGQGAAAWNINDTSLPNATGEYVGFTSGSMGALNPDVPTETSFTLTGSALDNNLNAVIVSASNIGLAWSTAGLAERAYSELWNVSFVEVVTPVPAAVWLFGSGLIGLVATARRRK